MSSRCTLPPLIEPGLLGAWIVRRNDIWQMRLLNAKDLGQFCKDRGLGLSSDYDIVALWRLGLLRADLVVSRRKLRQVGFIEVGTNGVGQHLYGDERRPRRRTKGWGSAASRLQPLPPGVQPFFHPFRYYVLYHLNDLLELRISPMVMLTAIECYPKMVDDLLWHFQRRSGSKGFLQSLEGWNNITSLAVASEPWAYERLFGKLSFPASIDREMQHKRIAEHWSEVAECYRRAGVERIDEAREDLAVESERLEENQEVVTLLRLAKGESRLKLRGRLGGAMLLRTMAEMLRRATEKACETTLPEEDELGTRWDSQSVKEHWYGTSRLLDADRKVVNEFIRTFNLDYGVRLHWYVEGDTERGFLCRCFGRDGSTAIEVINLRGRIVERNLLAFRESLEADKERGVYSFVSVDGDRSDYLKVVQKAAEEEIICGAFFISTPDFEFKNFALEELEEVLWEIAFEDGAKPMERAILHRAIARAKSSAELLRKSTQALPQLARVTKGTRWGERLSQYAGQHPQRLDGTSRPVIEAVRSSLQAVVSSYQLHRKEFRVDPISGRPMKR